MGTAKLNQIIAIEKGVKNRSAQAVNENYHAIQKPELFSGFDKKYQPKDEAGDSLPPESKVVSQHATEVLGKIERAMTELFAVTARKDWTNMTAKANVIVNGAVIIPDAPVTFLLFLEKNLTDLRTIIGKVPLLDAAEDWNRDENSGLYRTAPVNTTRTKKIQKALVLYPATDKHPAQTQLITDDVVAGTWQTIKLSAALPKPVVEKYLENVDVLLKAVKSAREEANMTPEVASPDTGTAVFNYIFDRS